MSVAALQSIFPQSELGTFLALQKRDKERQLQELAMMVTGIRLFNKDSGKGGEGIDDCKPLNNCWHGHLLLGSPAVFTVTWTGASEHGCQSDTPVLDTRVHGL